MWTSSNGRFDWLNRFDDLPLFIKSHVESRDVPKKLTQHLYDLRFSRRFVLVRVAYLSSSEAYTNNWGLFGKENYLAFQRDPNC
jgi:hypothetical protein